MCASESFAFLTRWVPADERRNRQRVRARTEAPKPVAKRWLTGSVAGLALFAVSRWLMRPTEGDDNEITK